MENSIQSDHARRRGGVPGARPGQADQGAKGLSLADEQIIARLMADVIHRTDESLNDQFGISYNTWRKLMAGEPVRSSLLKRLEQRLGLEVRR